MRASEASTNRRQWLCTAKSRIHGSVRILRGRCFNTVSARMRRVSNETKFSGVCRGVLPIRIPTRSM